MCETQTTSSCGVVTDLHVIRMHTAMDGPALELRVTMMSVGHHPVKSIQLSVTPQEDSENRSEIGNHAVHHRGRPERQPDGNNNTMHQREVAVLSDKSNSDQITTGVTIGNHDLSFPDP